MQKKSLAIIIILLVAIGWSLFAFFNNNHPDASGNGNTTPTETHNNATGKTKSVGVKEGNLSPNITLQDINGTELSLTQLKGKKVILNFWATWCPPCKEEMPQIQSFYKEYQGENLEVLAVNLTTEESSVDVVRQFVDSYQLTFPILLDSNGQYGKIYQANFLPTTYILDEQGIILKKHIGPVTKEMLEEFVN